MSIDLNLDILKEMVVNHSFGLMKSQILNISVSDCIMDDVSLTVTVRRGSKHEIYTVTYPMKEYLDHLQNNRDKKINDLLND